MAKTKETSSGKTGNTRRRKKLIRAACILLALGILTCALLFTLGYTLKRIAVGQIRSMTGGKVKLGSVSINTKGWVKIEHLDIRPHKKTEYQNSILKAKKLNAHFSITSLLKLNPLLKEIKVDNFLLQTQHDSNTGEWNFDALDMQFPGKTGKEKPVVNLNKGTLRYSKVVGNKVNPVMEIPLNATFAPAKEKPGAYRLTITTARRKFFGPSRLTGLWKPGIVTLTGSVSSTNLATLERVWNINVLAAELRYDRRGRFDLKISINDMMAKKLKRKNMKKLEDTELFERKTLAMFQKFVDRYNPSGKFDFRLNVTGNRNRLSRTTVKCDINCENVEIVDRKFPYKLKNVTGNITVDLNKEKIEVNDLQGRHGDVLMSFNGFSKGFGENRKIDFKISSRNMTLNTDLYQALPTELKVLWDNLSPDGKIALEYHLQKSPQKGKDELLLIRPLGIRLTCRKFPYPLRNLKGLVKIDGDNVTLSDLIAEYDNRRIIINGRIHSFAAENSRYNLKIKAENLPLDDTLKKSLPESRRQLADTLGLTGIIDADVKVFTPGADGNLKYTADIYLKNGGFVLTRPNKNGNENINRFPVSNVTAQLAFTPQMIGIERLNGNYKDSEISLRGRIWLKAKKDSQYCLSLNADQLPLNEKIISLLPGNIEKTVSKLNCQGKINLAAHLNGSGKQPCAPASFTVDCLRNTINIPFADKGQMYHLKDVTGRLKFAENTLTFSNITAIVPDSDDVKNNSKIHADGEITLSEEKISRAAFSVSGTNIPLDNRLASVLPLDLNAFYNKISPGGYIDFNFDKILLARDIKGDKIYSFNGFIDLDECFFKNRNYISDVNARLKITGKTGSGTGLTEANVKIPNANFRFKGKKISNLKTDVHFDPQNKSWYCKHFTGDLYDGKLIGKFELDLGTATPGYKLHFAFENADLHSFLSGAKNKNSKKSYTKGRMHGSLSLKGRIAESARNTEKTLSSRKGVCKVRITDMLLGKTSPLAKLLYVLNLTKPQNFMFNRMLLDSYIRGEKILFRKFDLAGSAIAFTGHGKMDTNNHNIDLVLFARGRRLAYAEPSILQSLTETLGSAVVRIEITGNISDPVIKTVKLPFFKQAFDVLGR